MADPYRATSIFRVFKPDDIVFREGEDSRCVYHVEKGRLQVFTGTDDAQVIIGEIIPGEFVGELGVLQESPRNASVIALEETHVTELNKWGFIERVAKSPDKSIQLLHLLGYRIQSVATMSREIDTQAAKHKPPFTTNPIRTLFALINHPFHFTQNLIYKREILAYKKFLPERLENGIHKIRKNRPLFLEGQASHYACQVMRGKFKSIKSGHNSYKYVSEIGAGEFIGEIGLLENAPRNLTIIALTDSEIDVYDEERFMTSVCADPEKCFGLIKTLSQRLVELNSHLKQISANYANIINPSLLAQAKQIVRNFGELSFSTGRMLERDLYALQYAMQQEISAVQGMLETYYRYLAGKAEKDEMDLANAEFRNFLKTLGLGAMIAIPGSFITIPLTVKIAKSLGIDLLPKSRFDSD